VTGDRRAVLCVSVADCLPLFLFDESSGAFALLHSGWKGTGIVEVGVRLIREQGSRKDKLKALLGPCIGPCCYRIPRDRYELFERQYGDEAVMKDEENYYIDLRAANRVLLNRLGVKNVSVISDCTSCNPLLSSFRRDGKGFSGMLAVTGYF
jgi:YfiH family protein